MSMTESGVHSTEYLITKKCLYIKFIFFYKILNSTMHLMHNHNIHLVRMCSISYGISHFNKHTTKQINASHTFVLAMERKTSSKEVSLIL